MKIWTVLVALVLVRAAIAKDVHVWADNFGKENLDGTTKELAFGTIQDAIDAATTEEDNTIIVHPGVYDKGDPVPCRYKTSSVDRTTYARVSITKRLHIKGLPGHRDDTLIVGAPDPEAAAGSPNWGLGENAVHCVYNLDGANAIVEGLTLTNGYAWANSAVVGQGGAVTGAKRTYVVDCRLVGNTAYRGGAVYNTYCDRSYLSCNNASDTGAVSQSGRFSNCIFYQNAEKITGALFNYPGNFYNCTFCNNKGTVFGYTPAEDYHSMYGCIFTGSKISYVTKDESGKWERYYNCIADRAFGTESTVENCDPEAVANQFVSIEDGDYRLLNTSSAIGRADAETLQALTFPEGYVRKDYLGVELPESGSVNAGAVQAIAYPTTVTVVNPTDGTLTVEGGSGATGESVIYTGDKMNVIANLDRPFEGLLVNGSLQPTSVTNVEIFAGSVAQEIRIELQSGTNWFVSATAGNDDWSGAYAAQPCRTFQKIAEKNIKSGDCIHAAAGTYDQGVCEWETTISSTKQLFRSRALVPNGVTLVADEGAEKTIIRGADGTDPESPSLTAVRCVTMAGNGLLRGFTLTNGYCYNPDPAVSDGSRGGSAVWGNVSYKPVIEDCIVTGNTSYYGTLFRLTAKRCQIYGNTSAQRGAVGHVCKFYGCYIDGGSAANGLNYVSAYVNCTLVNAQSSQASAGPVNCVIVGGSISKVNSVSDLSHCLVSPSTKGITQGEGTATSIFAKTLAEMKLDAADRYCPLAGSPAINNGELTDAQWKLLGDKDLLGNPRLSGSKVDIGAFERIIRPAIIFFN